MGLQMAGTVFGTAPTIGASTDIQALPMGASARPTNLSMTGVVVLLASSQTLSKPAPQSSLSPTAGLVIRSMDRSLRERHLGDSSYELAGVEIQHVGIRSVADWLSFRLSLG